MFTLRRRQFAALALIVLAILSPPARAAEPFPVTVEHALGTTTVPTEPKRVIALIDRDADALLALGVVPIAIRSWYGHEGGVGPWAADALGDAKPVVMTGREINYEQLASLAPDLIVFATSDGDQTTYDLLSQIAPTVPLPKGSKPWGATSAATTLLIAEALGKKAEGEALIAELDAFLAAQKAKYPQFAGKTATYLDMYEGGIASYAPDHIVNDMMFKVGFSPNAATASLPPDTTSVTVSPELLANYDADVVVIYPFGRTLDELKATEPTFAALPSTTNGRAFVLEDLAFSQASVLSIPYALDSLLPRVAAALE